MKSKLSNLYIDSFDLNHQILVLSETWLNNNILDSEILCSEYIIFRRDRITNTTGGGVLIAVPKCLETVKMENIPIDNIEFIAVKIKLNCKNLFVTCSYIPPNSEQITYLQHLNALKSVLFSINPEDLVFVFGDFNLPYLSWKFLPDSLCYSPININNFIEEFLNNISDLCLFQINGVFNDSKKLLDLVFVNEPKDCTLTRHHPITRPEDRHHPTIEVSCNYPFSVKPNKKLNNIKDYCFKKTNYSDLRFCLSNTNWLEILSLSSGTPAAIDASINSFYNTLFYYIDDCVPKYAVVNKSGPPWNSNSLSRLKNIKNKFYKKYKQTGLLIDYSKYSLYRAKYNLLNHNLYKNYLNMMKLNLKRDPKAFFKFVNSKRKSVGFPSSMKYLATESSNHMDTSNMFADFFASTYSNEEYDSSKIYPFYIPEQQPISFPFVTTANITTLLLKLKSSFYSGPDGIPSCLLINCAEIIAIPLTILFNLSIKHGYFPKLWKKSFVIPLFKSGNKSNIMNYRGIAKLSVIPKLFEQYLTEFLSQQVSSILTPFQHGFRKGCSTTTNLLELTTIINNGFKNGCYTDVIYTDFSKAFDRVNHDLLLHKLYLMGFTNSCLNWIKSYLLRREQRVCFNNSLSRHIVVNSGVPQGSHLGPILFLLYINDLPTTIKFSNILMYADDVKMFSSCADSIVQPQLQQDLNLFFNWCQINLLDINLNKCKHIRFTRKTRPTGLYFIGDYKLEVVNVFLDLGILFDTKLSFTEHINMCTNKARGVFGFIKRWSKEFSDSSITKQLYIALVRPIIEYGSIIWDPYYNLHSDRIESVQKQFLLFILRSTYPNPSLYLPPYRTRLLEINLPTLKSRRTMLNVIFVINLIKGNICSEFLLNNIFFNVPQRPTRYYQPLSIEYFQQNYANADPVRRICVNFNELYSIIDITLDINTIKKNLILYLNR